MTQPAPHTAATSAPVAELGKYAVHLSLVRRDNTITQVGIRQLPWLYTRRRHWNRGHNSRVIIPFSYRLSLFRACGFKGRCYKESILYTLHTNRNDLDQDADMTSKKMQ